LNIGSILLAGGKGSRLGRDKAWIELDGKTLLQRAVSNLSFLGSEIIIVTATGRVLPPVVAPVSLKVVNDITAGQGPLVGIYTGLLNSAFQYNLVAACDMPFVNRGLVDYMGSMVQGFDVVIPCIGKLKEPLHAIYSRECLDAIEKLLAQGSLKIDSFLERLKVCYVGEADIERFDPAHLSFFNINNSADLKRAEEISGGDIRDIRG
jgi:molybdopterin-guanine dinucleotide biosynthesis protein A